MEMDREENGGAAAGGLAAVAEEVEVEEVGSSLTMERVAAAKQFIENHYRNQTKNIQERKERSVLSLHELGFLLLTSSILNSHA